MATSRRLAHILHATDNVATVLADLPPGAAVEVDRGGQTVRVEAQEAIAFGHKIAVQRIAAGEAVLKYGEVIGLASREISPGAHVHVHNVESQRGRGDLTRTA